MHTTVARRHHHRPIAAMAAMAMALVLPQLRLAPAAAAPRPYGRAVHAVNGTYPLWVRGFIADNCLADATDQTPCRTQLDPTKPRREATAQVKAMRQLAGLNALNVNGLYNNDPKTAGSTDRVQWETRALDPWAKKAPPPGALYTKSTGRR